MDDQAGGVEPPEESTGGGSKKPAKDRVWLHLLLFGLTAVTTTFWGCVYAGAEWHEWWRGLAYSAPLMGILLTHEMGHYLAARRHGIPVSLPYFIPFPFGLGTLGAVISMRGKIKSRNALIDVGAAGPLAGFVVAVVVLAIGLAQSPVEELPLGTPAVSEGNSIMYLFLKLVVKGEILPWGNRDVMMSPTALAGWIGFLVTMINLIPVGQLDGGHVAFGFFGDRYVEFCRRLHIGLPLLAIGVMVYVFFDALREVAPVEPSLMVPGLRMWPLNDWKTALQVGIGAGFPWLLWSGLVLLLKRASGGRYHPPVGGDELTRKRKIVALTVAVLFILIFTPVPLRGM
jgi:membrane-associated protease RseP (regulator of RpoE activity)